MVITKKFREIIKFRTQGLTYQEIADKFGVSRQRIHQIAKKLNVDKICILCKKKMYDK